MVGLQPDAEIGLLYSARSKWGLAFQAAFPQPGKTVVSALTDVDRRSYHRIFEAFYRGTFEAGVPTRIIHDDQIIEPTATCFGPRDGGRGTAGADRAGPPGRRRCDVDLAPRLRRRGRSPGDRAAYRLRGRRRPGPSRGQAGPSRRCRRSELPGVLQPRRSGAGDAASDGFSLSDASAATDWVDGLISDDAKVILGYDHPHFGQFPAVVTANHGRGRITTVGTLPNPALAADLTRWLVPESRQVWGRCRRQ